MTLALICELDLDILKMCLCKKNEVCRSSLSKVRARTGQTDTQTKTNTRERIITLHSRVISLNLAWGVKCRIIAFTCLTEVKAKREIQLAVQ